MSPSNAACVCAWCPDFDPAAPANAGRSHGLCADCARRLNAGLDALDAAHAAGAALVRQLNTWLDPKTWGV